MRVLLIAVSTVAIATPSLAQVATTPATAPSPAAAAPAAPEPAATPQDPKAIIATEFPTYDKDGNGELNRTEFNAWLTALKEKAGGSAMKPAEMTAWLKTAFAKADKDKDNGVSLPELMLSDPIREFDHQLLFEQARVVDLLA